MLSTEQVLHKAAVDQDMQFLTKQYCSRQRDEHDFDAPEVGEAKTKVLTFPKAVNVLKRNFIYLVHF